MGTVNLRRRPFRPLSRFSLFREANMRPWKHGLLTSLALAVVMAGCAGPSAGGAARGGSSDSGSAPSQAGPKRIIAAMMGNPPSFIEKAVGGGSGGRIPGITGLQQLVDAGLTVMDDKGNHMPLVAEAVPTIENGLWKL